jgi:hypothetical protein
LYHAIISISILRQPLVAAAATSQSVLVVVCVSRSRSIKRTNKSTQRKNSIPNVKQHNRIFLNELLALAGII